MESHGERLTAFNSLSAIIMKNPIAPTWLPTLRRAASTLTKDTGDISSVFPSLSGKTADPLPSRFSELKKSLIRGNEDAVAASWQRLVESLKKEIVQIRSEGSTVCPSFGEHTVKPWPTDADRLYPASSIKTSSMVRSPRRTSTRYDIVERP